MLPPGQFHPFQLDTLGLGTVLRATADHGALRCWVGIGGSATNDAGFGMARAMGWRFLDGGGMNLELWTQLDLLEHLGPPEESPFALDVVVAVDVNNPLLGPEGCSRIYGPQKGLKPQDMERAERCLSRLAACASREGLANHATTPGAGAAGGLGYGLLTFARARQQPGFDLFADAAGLDARLAQSDLVLTAEGSLDKQTLMGKGVGQVAERCRAGGVPCWAFAGSIPDLAAAQQCFDRAYRMSPDFASATDSMARPAKVLREVTAYAAKKYG
jgi:glycerate kinase